MPRRVARRLGRALGRRGAILVCYGSVWALYGSAMITSPPADRRGLAPLLKVMPLDGWGWLWVITGLVAVAAAFAPQGLDWAGFLALPVIVLPWTGAYIAAWLMGDYPRGWVAAAVWALIAVPVIVVAGWREPPQVKRVRSE